MELKINIPDAQKDRILLGFTNQCGYSDQVPDAEGHMIPNPETRSQFFKRAVISMIKFTCQTWEATAAARIAKESSFLDSDKLTVT